MENGNNSFEPSDPMDPNAPKMDAVPERGGCLSALLILMMIGNGCAILMYLAMGEKIARQAHMPIWGSYVMALFGILNIIFAYLIYQWKRAGVIGICINAALILVTNLALGLGVSSFGGLIGIIILIALVSPKWQHFD